MKRKDLSGYLGGVKARKAALASSGVVLADQACRNGGARRTDGKRAMLARADARARAVGVEPIVANY
ncbi:hypothetical protein AAJ72_09975 [Citromicrobium sp. RCC1885]|uniref:hypothetical protein n=1 Tax=unclassified Citromicrobium TaxID=2630544 RepID=UPI0006C8F7A6|nr:MULTISPECIES: hypothetical protein [unclassified Citromicrobium]KPM23223.1 hypothetical protein AAJ72_09975 [Citromicrobium sp. RCC1885]KPM26630.1 hypothetical protein AAJ74_10715 [Citromicrobium sp. RCC1878]OAM08853.1 hypothetical protein A0U43_09590 [Citromicrobium sp. RCC1897]|tara:strand:- start:3354 stop:3554 length:201 start_codon:yes stop_codon:yes gene_type:complete